MNTLILIAIVVVAVAALIELALMSGVIPQQLLGGVTTTIQTTIPATTTTAPTTAYSVSNCTLLNTNDIKGVLGVDIVQSGLYIYPQGTCSIGWIDTGGTGTGANERSYSSIALNLNEVEQVATQANLNFACLPNTTIGSTVVNNPVGMNNIVAVSGLGDYIACWYKTPWDTINFGKGAYRFQLWCQGDACSQAKAVQLAQIVVSRVG